MMINNMLMFLLVFSTLGVVIPGEVEKMVLESWDFDVADCKIYVLPHGDSLKANVKCASNIQHPLMALGYALGEKGIKWCGVSGFTERIEDSVYNGSFKVNLKGC